MKQYKTFITQDYCPDWSTEDAVREYITNALDSDAPFEFTYKDDTVYITSKDMTLDISCLTLGTSKNRNKIEAVGTHAEGSLIAMGILLRNGKSLSIQNGEVLWTPEFIYDEDLKVEILTIVEAPIEYHNQHGDYTVIVSGLSKDEIDTIIDRCLYLQDESTLGKIGKCEMGRVLFDKKGKLYVGGVYVTTTGLDYTYDFHPSYLHLNRDRKTVEDWDLKTNTARMLQMVSDASFIAELVANTSKDVGYLQYVTVDDKVKEECFKLYKNKYDGKILTTSQTAREKMLSEGYSDIIVEDDTFVSIVKSSQSYKEIEFVRSQETPLSLLETLLEESDTLDRDELLEGLESLKEVYMKRGVKWG